MTEDLVEKRKTLLEQSEEHKAKRNELNAQASQFARERNELNNATRQYVEDAQKNKELRDQSNHDVQALKEKRNELNDKANALFEEIDALRGEQGGTAAAAAAPHEKKPSAKDIQRQIDQLEEKQQHLLRSVHSRKINVNYHDSSTSFLEAVFAKGDRRLAPVIREAWKNGCRLDGWDEYFRYDLWMNAFRECGVDPNFYTVRGYDEEELLPWEHLNVGCTKTSELRQNSSFSSPYLGPS